MAVAASMAYVIFAAKESVWCWPAALVSTVIYTVIFYDVYLWMDSLLQVYYLVMAGYGWYSWQKLKHPMSVDNQSMTQSQQVKAVMISSWSFTIHSKVIAMLAAISLVVGYIMATFTPTHFPYLDAATTVYAVFATYLVTQKVVENWLYWVVIDLVSIYLYLEKGLTPTAGLFVVYVVIALIGYFSWRRNLTFQSNLANA